MRFDRIASLYLFQPLAACRGSALRIPILMYHSVSNDPDPRHPYFQTTTTPERFDAQMQLLRAQGYETVTLSSAIACLEQRSAPPARPVVITFDDGFRDFYTAAYPVLERYGFTASMFIPTGFVGDITLQFNGKDCMNWREVRELDRAGIEFGSHTVTHAKLKELTETEVERELRDSKAAIEDRLGHAAPMFAYPYAFPQTMTAFVGQLRRILGECGYQGGVNTVIGTAGPGDDRYFLKRLPVNSADDSRLFEAKLQGGYDWLHAAQALKKCIFG